VTVTDPESGASADGLVHVSQIRDGFIDDTSKEAEVGQEVQVRCYQVDTANSKMALSMKAAPGSAEANNVAAFENVQPSEWLEGKVVRITNFGAFVRLSPPGSKVSAEALLHISQISEDFLEDVGEVLEVGQEVKVRVVELDQEKGKMGVSMKQEEKPKSSKFNEVDLSPFEAMPPDQWLDGTVERMVNFGAFVRVTAPGSGTIAEGLVHLSQIKEGFVDDVGEELEVGQKVKVRVKSVFVEDGKLNLSMIEEGGARDQAEQD